VVRARYGSMFCDMVKKFNRELAESGR